MADDKQDRIDKKGAKVDDNMEEKKPVLLPKRPERPKGLTLFSKTRDLKLARGGKMEPSRSGRPKKLTLFSKVKDVEAASGGEGRKKRDRDATTLLGRHASAKDRESVKPTLPRRSSLREQEHPRRSRSKTPEISVDIPAPLQVHRSPRITFASPPRRSKIEPSSYGGDSDSDDDDDDDDDEEEEHKDEEGEANEREWWDDDDFEDDEVVISSTVAEVDDTEQSASDFDDADEDVTAQRYLKDHEELLREAQRGERPKANEYLNKLSDRHRSWVRQRSQR
ncbi:MAG: hypothetical protein Q9179_002989 [Wetmoreana sp. 5 TL-2023]